VTSDLVVVVPGIMGSTLADARGRELWSVGAGGLSRALATLGGSIRALELPSGIGDGPAPDGVVATGLIDGLHVIPGVWSPIDGYRDLVRFLREPRFGLGQENLVLFAYDWRLSNRFTAQLLKRRVDDALARWRASAPERAEARVLFICHSMGGLVTRWYLDQLGGAETARALVTLGTPHRGAVKAIDQLVNGVRVGPLKTDFTAFARSLPSTYQLLPEYACVEGLGSEPLKTTQTPLPSLDTARVADAMAFYEELNAVAPPAYPVLPIVGINQPTWTTVAVDGERVIPRFTISGNDRAGDGTVPRLSARPKRMDEGDPSLRGLSEGHGALAVHRSTLDQLDFLLTRDDVIYKAAEDEGTLGVSISDLHAVDEDLRVSVVTPEPRVLEVVLLDEAGGERTSELVVWDGSAGTADLGRPGPGGYTVAVRVPDDPGFDAVHAKTLVW
jgi:pimeloyl-ACP methyl ester carboxylesterase